MGLEVHDGMSTTHARMHHTIIDSNREIREIRLKEFWNQHRHWKMIMIDKAESISNPQLEPKDNERNWKNSEINIGTEKQ